MTDRATKIRWQIFLIVALGSFVSYVLRTNLSIAAPAMIKDLALTEIQWGYVMAAFPLGYAVFQLPGGAIGDRFGPKRVLTIIGVLWALLTMVTAIVPGPALVPTTIVYWLADPGSVPGRRCACAHFSDTKLCFRAMVPSRQPRLAIGTIQYRADPWCRGVRTHSSIVDR